MRSIQTACTCIDWTEEVKSKIRHIAYEPNCSGPTSILAERNPVA